jgi:hypothetical protein
MEDIAIVTSSRPNLAPQVAESSACRIAVSSLVYPGIAEYLMPIAEIFAKQGWDVFITSRQREKAEKAARAEAIKAEKAAKAEAAKAKKAEIAKAKTAAKAEVAKAKNAAKAEVAKAKKATKIDKKAEQNAPSAEITEEAATANAPKNTAEKKQPQAPVKKQANNNGNKKKKKGNRR